MVLGHLEKFTSVIEMKLITFEEQSNDYGY